MRNTEDEKIITRPRHIHNNTIGPSGTNPDDSKFGYDLRPIIASVSLTVVLKSAARAEVNAAAFGTLTGQKAQPLRDV